MKERPILFTSANVNAILREDNPKTQTRRIVKLQEHACLTGDCSHDKQSQCNLELMGVCPYQIGQHLWVRETFQFVAANSDGQRRAFKSSVPFTIHDCQWIEYAATPRVEPAIVWKPSIFMPRWASRITLEITKVRVERLQDITDEDAIAEGAYTHAQLRCDGQAVNLYRAIWESINGKGSWELNPWVWVIEFKRIKP